LDVFQEVKKDFISFKKYFSVRVASILTDFLARYEENSRSSVSTAYRYRNCIYDLTDRKQTSAEKDSGSLISLFFIKYS
jgi:hypothetical protein